MMRCCGKKRALAVAGLQNTDRPGGGSGTPILAPPLRSVAFRYEGSSALTVVGPISRARYRFGFPGAVMEIDERDAAAVSAVPNVRRVY